MKYKLALDFGTTNSVIARWDAAKGAPEVVEIPALSSDAGLEKVPLVPSLLYVHDGKSGQVTAGQVVREAGLDRQRDNRLFRNFKRGIVATPAPAPRPIDGQAWADREAGQAFIRRLIQKIPYQKSDLEQLVVTAPVASFENYLAWLQEVLAGFAPEMVRIVDESTAAALGYAITEPDSVVLVFDFGGGTLDMSLVQLPESRGKTGGFLSRLRRQQAQAHTARVIAKAGQIIGGSDVDQWLLAEVLKRTKLTPAGLGKEYATLLTLCEQAKIALSTATETELSFEAGGQTHNLTISRAELESLLEEKGFYRALRRATDKIMYIARTRSLNVFREDVDYVLLVGGTSLMPSVQELLKQYFVDSDVRADKPFTAVAEGALQVAAGLGLEDYLAHGYGLRHLDSLTNSHQYDEIISMGTRYPMEKPVEVVLAAAHENQETVEFVIGQISTDALAMVEVKYEDGQAVFVAQTDQNTEQIMPLNQDRVGEILAALTPPGQPGQDRLKVQFKVDDNRQLQLTVVDLQTGKKLLNQVSLAGLR